jgi:hypothetical protein
LASVAPQHTLRSWSAAWGILGVIGILTNAVVRLAPRGFEVLQRPLSTLEMVALLGTLVFFAWTEGWKGFHLRFSPRVVARAAHIPLAPLWVRCLAPLACMGLVWANRRRLIASWVLIAAIVLLVIGVQQMSWPWRHIIDAGVVVGLSIGAASVVWHAWRASTTGELLIDPDLPAGAVLQSALASEPH